MADQHLGEHALGEGSGNDGELGGDGTHPLGRQPVGVNQPAGGGSDYPLLYPSGDVEHLLADFYLSHPDDACQYEYPFRITRLLGFDTPTPRKDVVVLDANDRVVVDTQTWTHHVSEPFGGRLIVCEWQHDESVVRCTYHTAWSEPDIAEGLSRTYPSDLSPESAELHPRTINRLLRRVTTLRVGATVLNGLIELQAGYNMEVAHDDEDDLLDEVRLDIADLDELSSGQTRFVEARRRSESVTLSATAGSGLGRVPGCEPVDPPINRINQVEPDPGGNFNIDAEKCFRLQRPVEIEEQNLLTARYAHPELTTAEAASSLFLANDCGPCCDCDFFVRTYEGIRRQWNSWKELANEAVVSRDALDELIERWNAAKACREADPLKVVIIPEPECKIAVGASFCNGTAECKTPLTLRFTFESANSGVADCLEGQIQGSEHERPVPYALAGTFPVLEATFDYADPRAVSQASFRICVPDCVVSDTLRVTVTAHLETDRDPAEIPPEISAIWDASALGQPGTAAAFLKRSVTVPLNNVSAFCGRCGC